MKTSWEKQVDLTVALLKKHREWSDFYNAMNSIGVVLERVDLGVLPIALDAIGVPRNGLSVPFRDFITDVFDEVVANGTEAECREYIAKVCEYSGNLIPANKTEVPQ